MNSKNKMLANFDRPHRIARHPPCTQKSVAVFADKLHRAACPRMDFPRTLMHALCRVGAPMVLGALVFAVLRSHEEDQRQHLDFIEMFSGLGRLAQEMRASGRQVRTYEILDDPIHEDFVSATGFVHALRMVLQLRQGACVVIALQCSSWVHLNVGTSRRRPWRPLGDTRRRGVVQGNLQATRLALLIYLLEAMGCMWVVEQPRGSLLFFHPRLQQILRGGRIDVHKHRIIMHEFGANCMKPMWLFEQAIPAGH